MGFTPTGLGNAINGARLFDQDQRAEERHNWAGERHSQNMSMGALNLDRLARQNQVEQGELNALGGMGFKPGEVSAFNKAFQGNIARDDYTARGLEPKNQRAKNLAQKTITMAEIQQHDSDLRGITRSLSQFEETKDASFLTNGFNKTYLGTGHDVSFSYDGNNNLSVYTDGKLIREFQGKDWADMMSQFEDHVRHLADPLVYQEMRKKSAAKLAEEERKYEHEMKKQALENSGKLAVEREKGVNQRTLKGMEEGQTITLQGANGEEIKVPRKQGEKMLDRYLEVLKKVSGNKGFMLSNIADMNKDNRVPVIQELINISKNKSLDENTQAVASRALSLMKALDYIPNSPTSASSSPFAQTPPSGSAHDRVRSSATQAMNIGKFRPDSEAPASPKSHAWDRWDN